jgi:hypothetical protein
MSEAEETAEQLGETSDADFDNTPAEEETHERKDA